MDCWSVCTKSEGVEVAMPKGLSKPVNKQNKIGRKKKPENEK